MNQYKSVINLTIAGTSPPSSTADPEPFFYDIRIRFLLDPVWMGNTWYGDKGLCRGQKRRLFYTTLRKYRDRYSAASCFVRFLLSYKRYPGFSGFRSSFFSTGLDPDPQLCNHLIEMGSSYIRIARYYFKIISGVCIFSKLNTMLS